MDTIKFISKIKEAAKKLKSDKLPTGVYGKLNTNNTINEDNNFVAKRLEVSAEAIAKLILEDRNIYLENDAYHQVELLNNFIDSNRSILQFDDFKALKVSIGIYINNKNKQ